MAGLQTIIYQIVLSIMRDSQFSSASKGHINKFLGVTGANTSIGTDEELKEAIREIIEDLGVETEEGADDLAGDLLDAEGKTSKKKKKITHPLLDAAKAGADPIDFLQQYAKKLVPIILPLLVAAGLSEILVETSLSPGGLFDRRLRRMITEEFNGLLDKQTQKNFSIGTRQLTIQSRAGFRNIQGIGSEDSLRQIREGTGAGLRKSNLDYIDFSKGARNISE